MIYNLKFLSFAFYFLPFTLLLSSCKTDLDVNAPYKDITVVYGLLNQKESIHIIKINKSFLGSADAYEMAKSRDSAEYKNIIATIEEWKNGAKTREWTLKDSTIINKEPGDFYYPEQTVYYFTEHNLDGKAQYRLNIDINNGEKIVSAKTELINDIGSITGGTYFSLPKLNFISSSGSGQYSDKFFEFQSAKDGKRYQLKMTINYYEFLINSSVSTLKKIDWIFSPSLTSGSLNGNEGLKVQVKGEDFYKEIQRQLTPITDDNIFKRVMKDVFFTLYIAADDLNTYLLANEPSTGIIQEKPEFTNIENGIGIFSSRLIIQSPEPWKTLDNASLRELAEGQFTSGLKFCENLGTAGCAPSGCNCN